ncbi:MAG TPA: PA2169 family four-helix-bundle protein [Pyrinomonadaceae bacterium]|nr:PA2169 family four-helix-bundle protein [Pyrinomonadaceae bacterium]
MINDYENTKPITSDATFDSTTASNSEVISTLNGLIETCKDGQNGFQVAAEGVERSDLKSLFYEFSQQRAQFSGELQSLVQSLGGDPANSGSMSAALHRGWINIKSAVTGKDEAAILNECERGEDSAKGAYKSALEEALPGNVMETIQTQYVAVQSAHDRVKALRDAMSGNTEDTTNDRSNTASTSY